MNRMKKIVMISLFISFAVNSMVQAEVDWEKVGLGVVSLIVGTGGYYGWQAYKAAQEIEKKAIESQRLIQQEMSRKRFEDAISRLQQDGLLKKQEPKKAESIDQQADEQDTLSVHNRRNATLNKIREFQLADNL
ncbi:hypothetical protein KBC04_00625 [Candidatus Babeliales bacterium]|nr:hypothetical protein [Candidatus Babeliales bacterium]MBP9843404.1 hypothetical protein [Candidatus Babeliales bacterium]